MRAAVEISMYPLVSDYRPLIQAFIEHLNIHPELQVNVLPGLAPPGGVLRP